MIFLGFSFAAGNPPTKSLVVRSQGGSEAILNYSAGFLGRDCTDITMKSPESCGHIVVFRHAGPSDLSDVKVRWTDEHHLQVEYHTRDSDPQHCEGLISDVAIKCVSTPWPE